MKKIILILASFIIALLFQACAAQTLIEKRNLEVSTKMSDSIFLDPVSPDEKIIYIKVRNTTDKEIDIQTKLVDSFKNNGFIITNDPKEANFMVQANLLQIGKSTSRNVKSALNSAFGGAMIGVGVASVSNSNVSGGGLIGAAIGFAAETMIKDIYITMITDVEIRQRALENETISEHSKLISKQGTSGKDEQIIRTKNVQWKKYRTRVVSVANQVNLNFKEAQPELVKALVKSISGII
ncbi:MAG TPA: hypothetical protein EYG73_06105 [Arcobacter sp.]|nr:hypothetical protein [Arcobacter sp.]